ncbi:hypothetical protein RN001_005898 [Aquatica leii]|uniref:Uncharacterized protein n=1 Tax=Aquatica leii TaxID=1421715 RepID=A0AAN7PCY1_9COLE|nr:hypothetical protein RN001_005898 [Aquatica leii]
MNKNDCIVRGCPSLHKRFTLPRIPIGTCEERGLSQPSTSSSLSALPYYDSSSEKCSDQTLQQTRKTYNKAVAECAARFMITEMVTNEVAGTSQQSEINMDIRCQLSEKTRQLKAIIRKQKRQIIDW